MYDLRAWPKIPLKNFTLNNCLLGVINTMKHSNKKIYPYNFFRIAFDQKGEWRFGNDDARNVIIFGIDNSSSSPADYLKNYFLVLHEGDTFGIHGSPGE